VSFVLNPYRYSAAAFYQYASCDGANADIYDNGGMHSSGTFTVPAAWNGRKVRVGAGGRSSANSTAVTITMNKNGSQFDGAAEYAGSSVTSNPGGATGHSAPIVVSTGDTFTMSGPVNNTNGSWKYMEVLASGVNGAMANRSSTFSVGTAFTTCEWNQELYDTNGYFTTGSPTIFTIPSGTSGLHRVQVGLQCTAPGTEMGLLLSTSADPGNMECDNAGGVLSIFSPPLALTTGNTASASVRTQSATTMAADNNTWFSIEELPSGLKYAIGKWGSSQSVSSGSTFTAVNPDTEYADVGGWFTATQDHFTVPSGTTGRVRLGFFIKSTNTLGSAWGFGFFKNGSEFQTMAYNAQTNASVECLHGVTGIIEVSAGDTFEFRARTAAGAMSVAASSFVWIEEVPLVSS